MTQASSPISEGCSPLASAHRNRAPVVNSRWIRSPARSNPVPLDQGCSSCRGVSAALRRYPPLAAADPGAALAGAGGPWGGQAWGREVGDDKSLVRPSRPAPHFPEQHAGTEHLEWGTAHLRGFLPRFPSSGDGHLRHLTLHLVPHE